MLAPVDQLRRVGALTLLTVAACLIGCGVVTVSKVAVTAPAISSQPQSVTVIDGRTAMFTVTAAGTAPFSYQWRRNNQLIANATGAIYSLAAAQYGQSGSVYTVTVGNSAGTVMSDPATLTVTPVAPTIISPPSSQSALTGASATFSVVASGTTPLSYQWNKNGVAIPGATNSNYIYDGAQLADNGSQITVTVSNVVGSISSSAVTLTVQSVAPSIVTQPVQQTVVAGAAATFVVVANGSPPLSFQWLKNGSVIAGATNATYETPATALSDSGSQFDVVVTNASGSVTSALAALTVLPAIVAPAITTQPQSLTAAVGDSATFSVAASGTQPLSYQWQVGGVNIPGATNSSYEVSPVAAQDNNKSYTVTVSNAGGSVTSQGAVLSVVVRAGRIDLIAGQLGGSGNVDASDAIARFYQSETLAMDAAGDVFVADTYNSAIREITATGTVIPIAGSHDDPGSIDGVGTSALFNFPQGIATDALGNVYVSDTGNQTIRRISSTGVVSTIAGTVGVTGSSDGPGSAALFNYAQGVATDSAGNIYLADTGNGTIREITSGGLVTTVAGTAGLFGSNDGSGAAARFFGPEGIAVDAAGNLYVADTFNDTIREITGGVVTTLAGTAGVAGWSDGTGAAAQFDHPHGIAVDVSGNLFVADTYNDTIRMITPAGLVTTVAGAAYTSGFTDGTGSAARFQTPWGIVADAADNLFVADFANDTVRKITPTAAVTTLAGTAPHPGSTDATGSAAQFDAPQAAATDTAGNIYIADTTNNTIRLITSSGVVTTLAGTAGAAGSGDGTGSAAQFNSPKGIATDTANNIYVADSDNDVIRKISPAGVVTTLAGTAGVTGASDGTGSAAQFNSPQGIVVDSSNNIYVADTGNDTIRLITPAGVVTTLAGTAGVIGGADGAGAAAQFSSPQGLAIDASGNIYVADSGNYTIRVLTSAGVVSTLAGVAGQAGYSDGIGTDARFNVPTGIAIDSSGNLYVVDSFFRSIREISPSGVVSTVAGTPASRGVILGPLPGSFNNPIGIAILPGSGVNLIVPDMGENVVLRVTLL